MTRASDVASFLSGVGPSGQPTTLGVGFTVTNSGDVKVGGALTVSGIVTAASYYGDGSNLRGIVSGVGISTLGGVVGTAITSLVFRGSGISTVRASAGIATINVEGGAVGFNKINYIFN